MKIGLAGLFLAACGGAPFSVADDGADVGTTGAVEAGEASAHDAGNDGGDVDDSATAPPSKDSMAPSASNDAMPTDSGTRPTDVAVDAPEASPCPVGGCICETQEVGCPPALPYVCNDGQECCNWRPPGC